jgi:hypothetical protein
MFNRAIQTTSRVLATDRAARTANALYSPTGAPVLTAPAYDGRGAAALMLADRVLAQAAAYRREIVSPDMENGDATVGDGSPEQEMEPLDPEIAPKQMDDDEEEDEEERQVGPEEDEDEEDQPRDEDGRFADARDVDITIVDVDEEHEHEPPEEEYPEDEPPP